MSTLQLPKMNCKYGSPMGRKGSMPDDPSKPVKLHLVRVRIDSGGYDQGGAYWGIGRPLYWATDSAGKDYTVDVFLRADDRADAKARVKLNIPGATFYR